MTLRVLGCCVLLASFGLAACSDGERPSPETTMAQEASDPDAIPAFEFDPTWPKTPLPNNWILGDIAGLHVDDQDQIWVLHRGNTVPLGSGDNNLALGVGDCCQPAPSFIVFDVGGNVVKAWGGTDLETFEIEGETIATLGTPFQRTPDGYDWPREHGLFVDHEGNVWTGCDQGLEDDRITAPQNCGSVTKFTNDGEVIWQKGGYGQGKGNLDCEAFHRPSGLFVDPTTNEAFISDGYGNKRVAVLDAETGEMKRIWGPYGTPEPPDIGRVTARERRQQWDRDGPPPQVWSDTLHCVEVSHDGLVYVCDRGYNRIQIFQRDGTFVEEVFIKKYSKGNNGTTFDVAFSPDPEQTFMYVADGNNHKVHILIRETLEVVGEFGHGGHFPGELGLAHRIGADLQGNVYVGDVLGAQRLRRFKFVGMRNRRN